MAQTVEQGLVRMGESKALVVLSVDVQQSQWIPALYRRTEIVEVAPVDLGKEYCVLVPNWERSSWQNRMIGRDKLK
jgi:hypothetical protein